MLLAAYGFRAKNRVQTIRWGRWLVVLGLLSLGPVLKVMGVPLVVGTPTWLSEGVNGALDWLGRHSLAGESFMDLPSGRIAIPLPSLILRWFVPGLVGMRAWARFGIFIFLAMAILAGRGLDRFISELKPVDKMSRLIVRVWVSVFLLLVITEYYAGPRPLILAAPREVDAWLASQDAPSIIIQLPIASGLSDP